MCKVISVLQLAEGEKNSKFTFMFYKVNVYCSQLTI